MKHIDNASRDKIVCRLFCGGETLQEIGDRYDLSRERVRQILKRRGIDLPSN